MRLISCYIANFGLHHEKKIDFNPGLNSFYWKNGEGKTTLTVFIKAMLYGFGDNRSDTERAKYLPWQGGKYGGSLTFEAGGKAYVVERTFGKKQAEDTFVLREEKTGGVSNYYTENLGFELFGIDREGFMRTAFLSEKSITAADRITPSVASRLSDMMGSDGDVGNYKDAIKKIDEERKLYEKRNGHGGEIKELEAKISELNGMLDSLELIARDETACGSELKSVKEDIARLTARREELLGRLAEIKKASERRKYNETYKGYLARQREEEDKIASLEAFFDGEIPTNEDINRVKEARAEAKRLRDELENGGEVNEELNRLSAIYGGGRISPMEIDEAEAEMRALEERGKRLADIESGVDERSQEMKRLFPARLPTAVEIDENIKKAKEKPSPMPKILLCAGIAVMAVGIVLGLLNPALFSICAGGILLAVAGILIGRGKVGAGIDEATAFLNEIAPAYSGDVLGTLYAKKNDLERYENLAALREKERTELTEKLDTGRQKIDIFFEKLGDGYPKDEATVRRVRNEYYRYTELSKSEEKSASGRAAMRRREEELRAFVGGFVRRYPTRSDDPIAEIEEKLRALGECRKTAADAKATCESFAASYGVTGEDEPFDAAEEERINAELNDIATRLGEKEREKNSLEYRHNRLVESLEKEDEIRDEIAAKKERLEICKRKCRILDTAKELLKLAHDNMTERYTGPTKERFAHYMKVITEVDGEYRLDTAFGITTVEKGEMHGEGEYSRGTKDLYSLAMRLALTDSLYEGELPFLVLDDPFISYDDERGARARKLLSAIAKERQILYFTCSDSRDI